MWSWCSGSIGRHADFGRALAIAVALALAGCAAQKTRTEAYSVGMPTGSGAQMGAPRSSADDPHAPWSPNYGTHSPIEDSAPARFPAPIEVGSTRIAAVDADAIIRHAVAEHEMRRP